MIKKMELNENKFLKSKTIIVNAIIGGILGAILGIMSKIDYLSLYEIKSFLIRSTLDEIVTEPILGVIIGGFFGFFLSLFIPKEKSTENVFAPNTDHIQQESVKHTDSSLKLPLREEQLNIYKKWIKTGEVSIHKESITEEKNITIPVIREELVIEKKTLQSEASNNTIDPVNIIRIPISEERVDISKHKVILEDVNIYKRQFEENKHIEETVKKEKLKIKTNGNPKIIDKDPQN